MLHTSLVAGSGTASALLLARSLATCNSSMLALSAASRMHTMPAGAITDSMRCKLASATAPSAATHATPGAFAVSVMMRGFAVDAVPSSANKQANSVPEAEVDRTPRTLGAAGDDKLYPSGYVAPHPGLVGDKSGKPEDAEDGETHYHKVYDLAYLESIKPTHLPPKTLADKVGLGAVRLLRRGFDFATGYGPNMTEAQWLRRVIFLETVAGVPGMVAGMLRHLHSLRLMRRDKGWIFTLLEEAENERMHLVTFLELRKPGPLFRAAVLCTQGLFFNAYFLGYLIWPKVCHAFVGYLEEEAVRTYTHALQDIDAGKLWKDKPAPALAKNYWGLRPDATMRDMILAVRADEACHSHVNHTLKAISPDSPNPFALGKSQLP